MILSTPQSPRSRWRTSIYSSAYIEIHAAKICIVAVDAHVEWLVPSFEYFWTYESIAIYITLLIRKKTLVQIRICAVFCELDLDFDFLGVVDGEIIRSGLRLIGNIVVFWTNHMHHYVRHETILRTISTVLVCHLEENDPRYVWLRSCTLHQATHMA